MIDLSQMQGWLVHLLLCFIAIIAFAFLFHAPKKHLLFIGTTAALGWICYIACTSFGLSVEVASFMAALVVTYLSRIFSYKRREPIITFLICGIFPIVPGAGIYYTGYNLFMGNNALGIEKGFETLKIAVAIALGIGIVSSLPKFLFTLKRNSKEGKA